LLDPPRPPSVSSATTFSEICERRALLEKVVAREETEALLRGKAVHEAIEDLLNLRPAVPSPDPWGVQGYLDRLAAWPLFKWLEPVPDGVERWFDHIPERMGRPGFWWNGKIDLISATTPGLGAEPCVLDWKTISAARKIKSEREAQKSLQLQIYCLVTGCRNAGFVWFTPSGPVSSTIVTFTEKELDHAWIWAYNHSLTIKARWGALADDGSNWQEVFAMAHPGHPLCCEKWCDYWDVCFNQEKVDMGSLQDAISVTGKYFTLEEFEKIGTATYTIRDITTVSMGKEEKEDKSVLFFVETPKGLVFNKSRIKQMTDLFPDTKKDYKDCGDKVKLVFDPTFKVNGKIGPMICIEAP
jgi:hypothetical protein